MSSHGWPTEAEETTENAASPASEAPEDFADVPLDEDGLPTEDAVRQALKAVLDPEIGISIVDLGLVYDVVKEPDSGKVTVVMTLTSMGCPLTELLHQQVSLVLQRLPGVTETDVEFTFTPPWSTDMMSDGAKDEMRAMGFNV